MMVMLSFPEKTFRPVSIQTDETILLEYVDELIIQWSASLWDPGDKSFFTMVRDFPLIRRFLTLFP